jgi:hypothetical protein
LADRLLGCSYVTSAQERQHVSLGNFGLVWGTGACLTTSISNLTGSSAVWKPEGDQVGQVWSGFASDAKDPEFGKPIFDIT